MEKEPKLELHPRLPNLRRPRDDKNIDVRYTVISPYVSVQIKWHPEMEELVYKVEDPILNLHELSDLEELKIELDKIVDEKLLAEKSVDDLITYVDRMARWTMIDKNINMKDTSYNKIFYFLYRDIIGLNELEPFMRDPFVENLEFGGLNSPVIVLHKMYGPLRTNVIYNNIKASAKMILKLAKRSNQHIDATSPDLFGILKDGSKVKAEYDTRQGSLGSTFGIKKPSIRFLTPIHFFDSGTVSAEMLAYLWILIQYKSNIIITGEKGTGKTTLLNALQLFAPQKSKMISIEEHIGKLGGIRSKLPSILKTKTKIDEGEVDKITLIKEAIKKKPDHIFIEELKGKEILALFQSMIPDHGFIFSIDAKNADEVIKKLLSPPLSLSPMFVKNLDSIVTMINEIIMKKDVKRLQNIVELVEISAKGTKTNVPFLWNAKENKFYFKVDSKVFEKIAKNHGITKEFLINELKIRTKLIFDMHKKDLGDLNAFRKVINDYYTYPQQVISYFDVKV